MVRAEDKRAALAHVYATLAPGGRLVVDHFVPDMEFLRTRADVPVFRGEYRTSDGARALLWSLSSPVMETHALPIRVISEELDAHGVVTRRRVRMIQFSWLEPQETRAFLEEAGFRIEDVFGDFERAPFDASSRTQIWIARKPSRG
jgi:hypothetical protein